MAFGQQRPSDYPGSYHYNQGFRQAIQVSPIFQILWNPQSKILCLGLFIELSLMMNIHLTFDE